MMANRYALSVLFLALATTLSAQFNFNFNPTAICKGQWPLAKIARRTLPPL